MASLRRSSYHALLLLALLALAAHDVQAGRTSTPVPRYCSYAPYTRVPSQRGGTCALPGNSALLQLGGRSAGCSAGGCWCNRRIRDTSQEKVPFCDQVFPTMRGKYTFCHNDMIRWPTKCTQLFPCNLWVKQDAKTGLVSMYAGPACARGDLISSKSHNEFKFGLVAMQGKDGGGCVYSQNNVPKLYSFNVGLNSRGKPQALQNFHTCYNCTCRSARDVYGWSQAPPAYVCPGQEWGYGGSQAKFKDSCNRIVDVTKFKLQWQVSPMGPNDWVDIGTFRWDQLGDKALYKACGTYRLKAYLCSTIFYRTILVRELEPHSYSDPALDQAGKMHCPGSTVAPGEVFGPLLAKVKGSGDPGVVCQFLPSSFTPNVYPPACEEAVVSATYDICPATDTVPVTEATSESFSAKVAVFESLIPSPGWAPVSPATPCGFVAYQCPGTSPAQVPLTLTSACPGRPPFTPAFADMTWSGMIDRRGCGSQSAVYETCGQKFARKVVQDVESIDKPPVGPPVTQCPGVTVPNEFVPSNTTATILGAPAGTPKCIVPGFPTDLGVPPGACTSKAYKRVYSLCDKHVASDERVLTTDPQVSDGGWSSTVDYVCPNEELNLTPVSLTTTCPDPFLIPYPYNPAKPVLDGPDLPPSGCGTVKYKISYCGKTFTKTFVRDVAVSPMVDTVHTICPGQPDPEPLFTNPPVFTVPGSNPLKTCTIVPGSFAHPPKVENCGAIDVTRSYHVCGTSYVEKAIINTTDTFLGFDTVCPFNYRTSCSGGALLPSTLVGDPQMKDPFKCEFTQAVEANVCGVVYSDSCVFTSCNATKVP